MQKYNIKYDREREKLASHKLMLLVFKSSHDLKFILCAPTILKRKLQFALKLQTLYLQLRKKSVMVRRVRIPYVSFILSFFISNK